MDCPSERGRNYTPVEPVRCVLPEAPCRERMIARSVPASVNHHRGSYTSPALAAASYPFVDLPPGNTLRCKMFPSSKFYNRPLYFSETMKYNEVNDKLEFMGRNFVKQTKIDKVQTQDNYSLDVKIDYLENSESIIIFCHGSGANTYDNHREVAGKEFNYFDLFADEFCKRNIAFCRWNTRGCRISDIPPDFVSINLEEYANYRPSTSIQDIIWSYVKI